MNSCFIWPFIAPRELEIRPAYVWTCFLQTACRKILFNEKTPSLALEIGLQENFQFYVFRIIANKLLALTWVVLCNTVRQQ
jgi:hypothetical protein